MIACLLLDGDIVEDIFSRACRVSAVKCAADTGRGDTWDEGSASSIDSACKYIWQEHCTAAIPKVFSAERYQYTDLVIGFL